jgi:hypothetical protein
LCRHRVVYQSLQNSRDSSVVIEYTIEEPGFDSREEQALQSVQWVPGPLIMDILRLLFEVLRSLGWCPVSVAYTAFDIQ